VRAQGRAFWANPKALRPAKVTFLPHDLDRLRHAVDDDADRLARDSAMKGLGHHLAAFDEPLGGSWGCSAEA